MAVLRTVARPKLASIFIAQSLDSALNPGKKAAAAEPVVRPLAERVPAVPAGARASSQAGRLRRALPGG